MTATAALYETYTEFPPARSERLLAAAYWAGFDHPTVAHQYHPSDIRTGAWAAGHDAGKAVAQ